MLKEKIKMFDKDGQLIEGYRVITVKRELRQVIYFKDKKESDLAKKLGGDYNVCNLYYSIPSP